MAAPVPWRRTFTIFWGGQFVALTGLALSMFSLGVYVYRLYDSPTLLGIAFALPILPFIVASPFAGPLVDRLGPRRAVLVSNVLGILNLLILAVLHAAGVFAAGRVMLFLFAAAAIKSMHLAAFETSVVHLVPKQHLGRANGMRMLLTAVGALVGPVVSIPLLLAAGVYGVILMGCLTFCFSILSLRFVRFPEVQRNEVGTPGRSTLLGEFGVVWRYVVARPGLVALMVCLAVVNFGIGGAELLFTQLTLSFAPQAAVDTVLLVGAFGLAAATVAMVVWGGPRRLTAGVVGYTLLFASAMVLSSLRPNVPLLAASGFVFLGCTPIILGTIQTLYQIKVEPPLLGRANALKNMFVDVPYSIANVVAGLAAGLVFVPLVGRDHVGSPVLAALVGNGPGRGFALAMMVIGVLIAVCVLLAYRNPRLRNLQDELPDVHPEDGAAADIEHAVAEPAAR